uniref:Uncharacterized protein n=1 Tax=Haptolina brevifila TaxID=156173 RepID=A0A7S2MTY3_9EUKA
MAELKAKGMDTPLPDGWAVWQLTPSKYDPTAPDGARGGKMYPCLKSPPMLDFDDEGNVYCPQDSCDTVLYINRSTQQAQQLEVPFPERTAEGSKFPKMAGDEYRTHTKKGGVPYSGSGYPRITGPAIATAPNGSIWMTLLGTYNSMVRFDPDPSKKPILYEFGGPPWAVNLRLIHLTFSDSKYADGVSRIYAIASDLLDDSAVNSVVILQFKTEKDRGEQFKTCVGQRIIPLPTQDCACHRISFVDAEIADKPRRSRSIVISEMQSSKLLQIKVGNVLQTQRVIEKISTNAEGFEVRSYTLGQDEAGLQV